jgi:GAF domain-containing protein
MHRSYNPKVDGHPESFLLHTLKPTGSPFHYAFVLRRKETRPFFTDRDEALLAYLVPVMICSLKASEQFEQCYVELEAVRRSEHKRGLLLEVAQILSGQLQLDVLLPQIMDRGCALVKADRCSLFIHDEARGKLITSFHGGLDNAIEIPINAGIVGYSATSGKIANIANAYDDPRFSRETDRATGYRTESLLCVPIFNEHGGLRGVTEMINKKGGTFTTEDEEMIQMFNIFAGISIENARLYRASIDLSMQLRGILEISQSMTQSSSGTKVLNDLLRNGRRVVGAASATVYVMDDRTKKFDVFAVDGDVPVYREEMTVKAAAPSKKGAFHRMVQGRGEGEVKTGGKANDDCETQDCIMHAVRERESTVVNRSDNPRQSLIVVPLIGTDRKVIGAVVMQWKKRDDGLFTPSDQQLVEGFAVFIAISIQHIQTKPTTLSAVEVAIRQNMGESERLRRMVPVRLAMNPHEIERTGSGGFSALELKEPEIWKVPFWIFDTLGIRQEYEITNEGVFAFAFRMRERHPTGTEVGFPHALGMAQMLVYTLVAGKVLGFFTPMEKLAMVITLLALDLAREEFRDEISANARTVLGIITSQALSVERWFLILTLMNILSDPQTNILACMSETQLFDLWGLLIELESAVDGGSHFDILGQVGRAQGGNVRWYEDSTSKLLVMKLLIRALLISDIARPLAYASIFKAHVINRLFDTLDLTKCYGMIYTDEAKTRDKLDREASTVALLTYICIPVLNRAAEVFPVLGLSAEQLRHNLRNWERG